MTDFHLATRMAMHKKADKWREPLVRDAASLTQCFCHNDYLGHAQHPQVIAAAQAATETYGTSSTGSALITGQTELTQQFETRFAEFVGFPAARFFSSGYLANLAVQSVFCSKNDLICQDKLCHASLIDGAQLSGATLKRYAHGDVRHLRTLLMNAPQAKRFIVTDTVFSMRGDCAPLGELSQVAKKHSAHLIVDDAHGLGVLGENGRGALEAQGVATCDIFAAVYPLGKAWGSAGAIVAGSQQAIDALTQFARPYCYDTASPPSVLAANLASLDVVENESWRREKLHELVAFFREQLAYFDLPHVDSATPIQSIVIGDNARTLLISEKLQARGFWVHPIRPPSVPENQACLRVTVSVSHSKAQLKQLAEHLADLIQEASSYAA